ncbi:Glutathione-regulated potassium-efflux system protein KefB [uncultured archaeon]|nr:Glutathione-regulated potassium-efflux system protein KefB [uncultured archaeon]
MKKDIQNAVHRAHAHIRAAAGQAWKTGGQVGAGAREVVKKPHTWPGYLIILLGALMLFGIVRTAFFGEVESGQHIWIEITLLLLIAVVAERLVQQWQQPFVMVLLILGVVISPYTLQVVWPPLAQALAPLVSPYGFHPDPSHMPNLVGESELIKTFANLGVMVLLFRIGLHSKLELVFNFKNLMVALGGVVLPFALGFFYAQGAGGSFAYSLFVGAALTATSVGITAAVLEELKLMDKAFAQTILGAAVIDDILALLVLGLIESVPSEVSAQALAPFGQIVAVAVIFILSGLALGRWFMGRFFPADEPELSKRTLAGLLAMLFFYAFAAESLGLSAIVGAFLAGLVVAASPLADKLNRALFPLDVLFTPVFFISLGMLVDVWAIPHILLPVLMLTLIAIVAKVIGAGLPARLFGMSGPDSLLVGFGMVPRGEIALIIALLGLSAMDASGKAILSAEQYTLIASMAFLTTAIVPLGLKWLLQRLSMKGAGQLA